MHHYVSKMHCLCNDEVSFRYGEGFDIRECSEIQILDRKEGCQVVSAIRCESVVCVSF